MARSSTNERSEGDFVATTSPRKANTLASRQTNLVGLIRDELYRRIIEGQLPVGHRIVIDQLAEEFGTSLIPVREALARLHVERLVSHEQNKGYRVAAAPDVEEMGKLFDARMIIEIGALESGFDNIDDTLIANLERFNDGIAKGSFGKAFASYQTFLDLNAEFHRAIVALAQNPYIDEAYHRLGYHERVAQTLMGRGPDDVALIVKEHGDIIEALRARNLESARKALQMHIHRGREDMPLKRPLPAQ